MFIFSTSVPNLTYLAPVIQQLLPQTRKFERKPLCRQPALLTCTKPLTTRIKRTYFPTIYYRTLFHDSKVTGATVAPTSQVCTSATFVSLMMNNINDDVGVSSNGITSVPSCVKIGHMVQGLKWVDTNVGPRRQHSNPTSQPFCFLPFLFLNLTSSICSAQVKRVTVAPEHTK